MQKIIAVVGPTSSGKTSLGIFLAQKLKGREKQGLAGAEIISADSRQVYKGLDIGTGKVTKKEMAGVKHHLLDVANPKKKFNASDFKKLGETAIDLIYQVNKIPIIVGGTGLYADVLLGRMVLPEVPPNAQLRKELEKKTNAQLFALLKKLDPERASNIEPNHQRRLIRAIEIAKVIGKSPSKPSAMEGTSKYNVLWIGLNPAQETLEKNITKRLKARIKLGMVAEAKRLRKQGVTYKRMRELGLEYSYLADLLEGKITQKEFETNLNRAITQYAKRQKQWFKRNPHIVWVGSKTEALQLAKQFIIARA